MSEGYSTDFSDDYRGMEIQGNANGAADIYRKVENPAPILT